MVITAEQKAKMAAGRAAKRTVTVKTPSLRRSINEYCKSCIYDPHSGLGTWRQQVEACTVIKCELYAVRPRSTK